MTMMIVWWYLVAAQLFFSWKSSTGTTWVGWTMPSSLERRHHKVRWEGLLARWPPLSAATDKGRQGSAWDFKSQTSPRYRRVHMVSLGLKFFSWCHQKLRAAAAERRGAESPKCSSQCLPPSGNRVPPEPRMAGSMTLGKPLTFQGLHGLISH